MYLQYIDNKSIDRFVKTVFSPNARIIFVEDCDKRNYVNVFTNLLDTTLHFNDFECINLDVDKQYHELWRKFMVKQLDAIDPTKRLGNQYFYDLQSHVEKCDICAHVK